jgi:hypothetical protein
MKTISFGLAPGTISRFSTLLQSGFYLEAPQGIQLGELLFTLPGFTEEYVKSRIETIFLDGLPVDELEQQLFGEELVIALSAAMPGLAGAIFRKGGVHASLRTETAAQAVQSATATAIRIRIKLFNVIAAQRGADVLCKGCEIMTADLLKYLAYRPALLAGITTITMNDTPCETQELLAILHQEERIQLFIKEQP